ncbi:piggyBac transposable element-derived protein 3-like [Anthonomus grandis grandis]|uniref:piggyBac transposable element-derived protein 3-like n=1 Tax=Anthonomus grandis grandis TaxID=2921223 RepID=UPI0021666E1F|nr:piggyBac transposable element-derived protein 3-like [Anthonomus grandis grandis]
MVPYFGRHPCKMFIKGKSVRFGFKLWCLCSSNGYLFYSLLYAGAQDKKHSELGLDGGVVMSLLSVVEKPQNHQIFFDNFFSTFKLFGHTKQNVFFFATGTIRDNRTSRCPFLDNKKMEKTERDEFDAAYDANSKISFIRWNDNSVVTVGSNIYNIEPLTRVKRYNKKQLIETFIQQPYAISQYNKFMGGVDLHDNGIANYRSQILGKKWWWPIFCNALDSLVVNAWKIYNLVNKKSQVDFKSYIALRLLKTDANRVVRNVILYVLISMNCASITKATLWSLMLRSCAVDEEYVIVIQYISVQSVMFICIQVVS